MIVTLDGAALTENFETDDTLQALVDCVRDAHLGQRLVVSVSVNGRQLVDKELAARLASPIRDLEQIDLTSADRWELAADALREVADWLSEDTEAQSEIADLLLGGKIGDAVRVLSESLARWQNCNQAILECSQLLDRDLTTIAYADRPVQEHLEDLAEKLRSIRDALEARDMVLLADVMQYEMPELCETWQQILRHLADTVSPSSAQSTSVARAE